ncbi:hypothetical protein [Leptospira kmetyi]|uniref:Uncharacterized protein n=1 Tax=Leptospira kmetyi TaxID=408139 RepID=A0AAD0XQS9_9LEPT|nr:hypothetical protein [Leptospira kmetyi]AYV56108.1 hypothetical protein EFP84_11715 [Leptospira kmetyi]PJZ27669.1 hypothetical protein CH378_21860 [Leptospira kmetyi]
MNDSNNTKRSIVDGKVVHEGKFWRRGRILSVRLEQIVVESELNLRDIAFKYSQNVDQNSPFEPGPLYREHLADVIKGIRNTARYVKAIEESWKLPIEQIRAIYRKDKEMEKKGEAHDPLFIREFADWYREVLRSQKEISNLKPIPEGSVNEIAV